MISTIYHSLKIIMIGAILITRAPAVVFTRVHCFRLHWQHRAIHDLLNDVRKIVPVFRISDQGEQHVGRLAELADMRDVLWTNFPHEEHISPQQEAELIRTCLESHTRLVAHGDFALPMAPVDTTAHYVAVAKHLRKLARRKRVKHVFSATRSIQGNSKSS